MGRFARRMPSYNEVQMPWNDDGSKMGHYNNDVANWSFLCRVDNPFFVVWRISARKYRMSASDFSPFTKLPKRAQTCAIIPGSVKFPAGGACATGPGGPQRFLDQNPCTGFQKTETIHRISSRQSSLSQKLWAPGEGACVHKPNNWQESVVCFLEEKGSCFPPVFCCACRLGAFPRKPSSP